MEEDEIKTEENVLEEETALPDMADELDSIFHDGETIVSKYAESEANWVHDLKLRFRFLRMFISSRIRSRFHKNFKEILYVTLNEVPSEFILALRNQYPDKEVKVITPVLKPTKDMRKTSIHFEYFLQNKKHEAILYKLPQNQDRIFVYGLYSDAFCGINDKKEFNGLVNQALLAKALRTCIRKLNSSFIEDYRPDIIHSEDIPFFLGSEFEKKSKYPVKVLQEVKDFSFMEFSKKEAFWALINIADKKTLKKICKDNIVRKCFAGLLNQEKVPNLKKMYSLLNQMYEVYPKSRNLNDENEESAENILFNRLNQRAVKLCPELGYNGGTYFNPIVNSIRKSDFWAVPSETYFNELISPESGFKFLSKYKSKGGFLPLGFNLKKAKIYQDFNTENFRDIRFLNKRYLLREFSEQRIKIKFIDRILFNNQEYSLRGYLDSFYEAPLIFCRFSNDIFSDGVDIAFNTLFKLFEQNKNIQVIINIPNGLEDEYIKKNIEFLEKDLRFSGRWLYIDSEINLPYFYSASDFALFPKRFNPEDKSHYLALKYGCIPVVSLIGVYQDTVSDIFDDAASGCGFKTPESMLNHKKAYETFYNTTLKALDFYTKNSKSWNVLVKNALNYDSSWNFKVIEKYNEVYENM